jgi:8-oxo-dGTP diphosphatase
MILTTTIYLRKEGYTLMLHRTKKKNDINEGKWIGVGGKLEKGESPFECAIRETFEETGYHIIDARFVGMVTFPGLHNGEDELMFIYESHHFEGELHGNDEGELKWIKDEELYDLPSWPADYYYLDWLKDNQFHQAKVIYDDDGTLVSYSEE